MNKNDFITQAKSHTPGDDEMQKMQLGTISSYKKLSCYTRSLDIYQELIQSTIAKSELIVNTKYWFCQKEFIFKYLIVSVSVEKLTSEQKSIANPLANLKKTYENFFGGSLDDIFGIFKDKKQK